MQSMHKKKLLFILFSVFAAFLATSALTLLAEVVFRFMVKPRQNYEFKKFFSAPPPFSHPDLPTHTPVVLPPKRYETKPNEFPKLVSEIWTSEFSPGYFKLHPRIGVMPSPNRKLQQEKKSLDGRILSSVVYEIDSESRRVVPGSSPDRESHIVFLGCSFTFGESLKGEETLPGQLVKFQKKYHIYNYSFHGWGPGNILRLLNEPNTLKDIPQKPRSKAIYVYIDSHLTRLAAPLSMYKQVPRWPETLPYYELDSHGNLYTDGMIADHRSFLPLLTTLSQSRLLNYFDFDYPQIGEKQMKLMQVMLIHIQKVIMQKQPGIEFYVLFYPQSHTAKYMIPLLDEVGIRSIDYSQIPLGDYIQGPTFLFDSHPTAPVNQFLAEQLARDLKL